MNAITVNYAEVGDDHLPISFGFVRNSDLMAQTIIYNSKKIKINDTCSVLTCGELNSINIIVSSDPETSRSLTQFSQGPSSWIEHKLPTGSPDSDFYIKYKDGYYYKMVENENGKSSWEQYAPYAYLTNVKDNARTQPYCEATIKTPVPLQVSAGSVKAVINSSPVEIAQTDYSLTVKLENADGNYIEQPEKNEYSIDTSIYDLNHIVWKRDDKTVTSWLLDSNKIVKSDMLTNGQIKTIKLLAGNNIVTIPRNKSTITINFTFTNTYMSSFEWGGAYHNGFESSTMSSNTLTLYNVRQDSSKNLTTFFTGSEAIWFNPSTIDNLPGSGTFNVDISIPTPSVTDKIKFTGWIDGKLEQEKYIPDNKHGILPETYTVKNMNTESLNSVDIKVGNETTSLLSCINNSTQFKRHRQLTHIQQSSTGSILSSTTAIDDIKAPSTSSNSSGGKDIYIYTKDNNIGKTFNVTAHYTSIPAVVSVNDPSDTAVASTNQVVLFEGAYYVADINMKSLVESLVSGVTVTAQKEIVRNVAWQTTTFQNYYKMNTTKDETNVTYTPKFANITISGINSQVTSVKSSNSYLTAQLTNQALSGTDISITIHYTVPDGYSLLNTGHQPSLDVSSSIPASDWNKTVTYKFFN